MSKIYNCAVLGDPIAHSLSPVLHNAAYKALGLTNWQYCKKKVSETELADFIRHLDESWKGLSLTMPLKKTVMELGTSCDYWSSALNVANTAVFISNPATVLKSQIELYNTDVKGIVETFRRALQKSVGEVKKAVIIGSGNTASSAMAALIEIAQVSKLEKVQVVARVANSGTVKGAEIKGVEIKGVERFNNLVQKYSDDFPDKRRIEDYGNCDNCNCNYKPVSGIEFPTISEEVFSKFAERSAEKLSECDKSLILKSLSSTDAICAIAEADIVISTVPAHVADGLAVALEAYCQNQGLKKLGTLLDVVYDPRPSALLNVWRQYGCGIGGEEMLLYQALEQVKLMTFDYRHSEDNSDKATDYDCLSSCMRKALQEAL